MFEETLDDRSEQTHTNRTLCQHSAPLLLSAGTTTSSRTSPSWPTASWSSPCRWRSSVAACCPNLFPTCSSSQVASVAPVPVSKRGGGGSISQKEWSHQPGLLCTRTHSHWTLQTLTLNPSFHPFIPPSTVPHTHSDIWLQTPTSAPIIPPLAKLAFSPR